MTVALLLSFIARFESADNYNAIWGGIARKDYPRRLLTQMTVDEVLAWQDSIDARYRSEAAGRYQIMEDTLRGLYRRAGVSSRDLYSEETQDALAVELLRGRGLDDFLAGKMKLERFGNALAKEWASLPVVSGPNKGRSYYAGDGLNKAHADVEEFLRVLETVRRPKPRPKPSILAALLAFFANWRRK